MYNLDIFLTNTKSGKKEKFVPIDASNVRMYVCGPTVYSRPHIGNARAAVVFDTLYRVLKIKYGSVTYVRNLTDIDDKIIEASKVQGITVDELTRMVTKQYHDDILELGCLKPSIEPRARDHIDDMVNIIRLLISNGHAYIASDHVLFDVQSFDGYCDLSSRDIDEMVGGARVQVEDYKKYHADFVLWKPEEEQGLGFYSPWGYGRPGWHIECSAMSYKYLGLDFDIHGGGIDLLFPHHENERAQSCCAFPNSIFAKYWVHNGFLNIDGQKMSKSLNNIKVVEDLLNAGFDGSVIRYALLSAHYRKPLNFEDKLLEDAKKSLQKFEEAIALHDISESTDELDERALEVLFDDMNTPLLFSRMHKIASSTDRHSAQILFNIMKLLGFSKRRDNAIPKDVMDLFAEREFARKSKDWKKSDELRSILVDLGYEIRDSNDGTRIIKIL
ncbi:Cysteine--tRNA ligase [Candidatus Cyrtobacter comes]|uniref:Cysteine--tRNA ligase n=1 Tax=Candidatus Cyrtobacter comes TaxID=675776 RepID=A0ABU5L8C2_9RICK|nr:cysteine--tRNA ligase [Candidatus Cyrtobacter comes]MDZ5762371.1 Cysteine--tRNA ligase [Candidatus Cyrtobacter comes]